MGFNDGSGPGAITPDGCAVELYARLPTAGEPELIHGCIPEDASILDLGAGVGRIADPLTRLGHRVVAVDNSLEMLGRIVAAETVRADIEHLALDERLDVALLASHLVNTPDVEVRQAFLESARRHLVSTGCVLVQWHTPDWFDGLCAGTTYPGSAGEPGPTTTLEVLSIDRGLLTAVVTYVLGYQRWTHRFQARRLTVEELAADLRRSGLELVGFLTPDRTWFRARPLRSGLHRRDKPRVRS